MAYKGQPLFMTAQAETNDKTVSYLRMEGGCSCAKLHVGKIAMCECMYVAE